VGGLLISFSEINPKTSVLSASQAACRVVARRTKPEAGGEFLFNPKDPACPVAPADGTGVNPVKNKRPYLCSSAFIRVQ